MLNRPNAKAPPTDIVATRLPPLESGDRVSRVMNLSVATPQQFTLGKLN